MPLNHWPRDLKRFLQVLERTWVWLGIQSYQTKDQEIETNQDPDVRRQLIDPCITHFQNDRQLCAMDSGCKNENFVPDFTIVWDPLAVRLLTEFLHSMTLSKYAQDYVYSKDIFCVESFNNTCLIYLQKWIHYKDTTYKKRMNLSILSWNEHVDRPFTSRTHHQQAHHNKRNLGKQDTKRKPSVLLLKFGTF